MHKLGTKTSPRGLRRIFCTTFTLGAEDIWSSQQGERQRATIITASSRVFLDLCIIHNLSPPSCQLNSCRYSFHPPAFRQPNTSSYFRNAASIFILSSASCITPPQPSKHSANATDVARDPHYYILTSFINAAQRAANVSEEQRVYGTCISPLLNGKSSISPSPVKMNA